MLDLEDLNGIFGKPAAEVRRVMREAEKYVKTKDRIAASALGMRHPEKIYIIRVTLEAYDLLNEKTRVRELALESQKIVIKDELATKEEPNQQTQGEEVATEVKKEIEAVILEEKEAEQEEVTTNEDQAILIYTECGIHDYGTQDLAKQIKSIRELTGEKREVERKAEREEQVAERSKDKEYSKTIRSSLDESIHAQKNYTKEEENNKKKERKELEEKKSINITLWDLPGWYSSGQVRRLLSHLGQSNRISFTETRQGKRAVVNLQVEDDSQEREITNTWALGLENGKLTRLTPGILDFLLLNERRKYSSTLSNIPPNASETLILRAVKSLGAKAVYIPYNSNWNARAIAWVNFDSRQSQERATRRSINYYNSKLTWKRKHIEEDKEERTGDIILRNSSNSLQQTGRKEFARNSLKERSTQIQERREEEERGQVKGKERESTTEGKRIENNGKENINFRKDSQSNRENRKDTSNIRQVLSNNRHDIAQNREYESILREIIARLERIEEGRQGAIGSNRS